MRMSDWILVINIVLTSVLTIYWQIQQKRNAKKEFLDKKLMELQRISFEFPYVEDTHYTNQWNDLKDKYRKDKLSQSESEKFLKYDVYTEMLFNFVCETYSFYESRFFFYSSSSKTSRTEKMMLDYIAFKPWLRTHEHCWRNPLIDHDNRDTYGDKICEMINKWMD